ncbi:4-hydroxy-tetrahydrodipicolinate reductase [Maridesulfovibrio hydrothermalis]|uniref:4-hydroxy-tetrahydrodipicolinate reductase n=1 Tax=Maridesulfovibrio hydrothermalis AM13 = DSM 14728 TaxID=1121451 RepID=L0REG6_9BACT|nr:4-hydroxy-tetrahydrodipicolinate reductase [Maridesulfovibrio hydrothermalis]CCO24607.1 Dihydrodipicolinate reductase [Maridesulfovibrio hydrothermalis AM13 = DSM 14728]
MTDIVIMGAKGRMGDTLVRLTQQSDDLNLAGVLERSGCEEGLDSLNCVCGTSPEEVLTKVPGAVVIDFTAPAVTLKLLETAAVTGNPVVIGTTGMTNEELAQVEEFAKKVPVFLAPNMSVGVNVLLKILPELVRMLGPAYDMEMTEIHHNKKVDSPSGTALKLAQCMAEARGLVYDEVKKHCRDGIVGARTKDELGVMAVRGGDVVGDHTAYFLGPGERIEVTHRAHSRETFAQGALRAAGWIADKKPGKVYSMADIF